MTRCSSAGVVVALAAALAAQETPLAAFDFAAPRVSIALPPALREVSGLAAVDRDTVACVQDEVGALYFVDLRSATIVRKVPFGPRGDYEELARVDDAFWVLRSDGQLFALAPRGRGYAIARTLQVGDGASEFEAVAFDPLARHFLAAPKHAPAGYARHERPLFAIDPATGERAERPVLVWSRERIEADAAQRQIALPHREGKHGQDKVALELRPSSLAVQPDTGRLFVLSAADALLLVFARDGALVAAQALPRDQLPQAEAIAFLPDGALAVASEGGDGAGRVVVFARSEPVRPASGPASAR